MFQQFKAAHVAFTTNLLAQADHLFLVEAPGGFFWDTFINGLPAELQPEYTCNACRSFLQHFGGLVVITPGGRQSIWDFEAPAPFDKIVKELHELAMSFPIRDVLIAETPKLGIDHNNGLNAAGEVVTWHHLSAVLPRQLVTRVGADTTIDTLRGEIRTRKQTLKRALTELKSNAVQTVLELIAQGSLYKGEENQHLVQKFAGLQAQYALIAREQDQDDFCWQKAAVKANEQVCGIRTTSIGTLIEELSEGKTLDNAVTAYEKKTAPENYKRPKALVTQAQIDKAERDLQDLGLTSALHRRFANFHDLDVTNCLFIDRSSPGAVSVLGSMLGDMAAVNPKTLAKMESVTLDTFIHQILPTATKVEYLLENRHEPNLMSLITSLNQTDPTLFKWNNNFSWSYNNGLADSAMKQRVKAAGGNVQGVLRFSIQWNHKNEASGCDLDAHAWEPKGEHIYFSAYCGHATKQTGILDVDIRVPGDKVAVENIVWTDQSKMQPGVYTFGIHNFNSARNGGFEAEVEVDGEIHTFSSSQQVHGHIKVAEVHYDGNTFEVRPLMGGMNSTGPISKPLWGMNTQVFTPVKAITYSPNFWDEQRAGHRHVFLFLDKAHNEGPARGFLNEFLKPELEIHGRVFETLGGKLQVQPTDEQLSGVGFATSKRNEFFVRVEGAFKRTLKVTV